MQRANNYKTSNDLNINAKNAYPWLIQEVDDNNPYNNIPLKHQEEQNKEEYNNISLPKETEILNLTYKSEKYSNSNDPSVWGPAFWFSLHNGAIRFPINPSPLWKERMKYFILGIPVMVPCESCSDHAMTHIEANYNNLDEIVSSRSKLFEFFWKFHNFVNKRLNKYEMTLEDAYKLYEGKVLLTTLKY